MSQLCLHFQLLEAPLTQDMKAMIAAADRGGDDNGRVVRDFKSRVETVTLVYKPLVERIVKASNSGSRGFSNLALRDAAKAEISANTLYSWAGSFVPTNTNSQSSMDKAAKLKIMPYIVAMAYAVRVKLDAYYVESSGVDRTERLEYLERSRNTVEQFIETVKVAVRVTLYESSLLDVALDYHLALTTYIMLMAALRASVATLLTPKDTPKSIAPWDDGLAGLRYEGFEFEPIDRWNAPHQAQLTATTTTTALGHPLCIFHFRFEPCRLQSCLRPRRLHRHDDHHPLLVLFSARQRQPGHPLAAIPWP